MTRARPVSNPERTSPLGACYTFVVYCQYLGHQLAVTWAAGCNEIDDDGKVVMWPDAKQVLASSYKTKSLLFFAPVELTKCRCDRLYFLQEGNHAPAHNAKKRYTLGTPPRVWGTVSAQDNREENTLEEKLDDFSFALCSKEETVLNKFRNEIASACST